MSNCKKEERKIVKIEGAQGGKGHILKDTLITEEQCGKYCKMFADIVLEPGCEIGLHIHSGDAEVYYITEGSGTYNDNGEIIRVKAGDVTFCEDGQCHGLVNDGEVDVRIIALILNR